MSDTNLNIKDLLVDSTAGGTSGGRAAVEKSQAATDLKAEVAKHSKLVKWDVVADVLTDKVVEMMDIPLSNILLPAWKKYQEIEKLGDPAAYPPEDTELVSLVEHTVKSEHHPTVEILFKGVRIGTIKLTVASELTLEGVVLRIKAGRVMAIEAGNLKGKASLAMEGQTIMEKGLKPIELRGKIDLGSGYPIRSTENSVASSATA